MAYYLYILECCNNTFYTGYTTDIQRRYQEHCQGSEKCKYTRSFPPRRIAACWETSADLSTTMKIESEIKKLSRIEKLAITENKGLLQKILRQKGYSMKTTPLRWLNHLANPHCQKKSKRQC